MGTKQGLLGVVSAKARRKAVSAMARRRAIFASKIYPKFRAAWASALQAQVRELATRAGAGKRPLLPDALRRKWVRDLVEMQGRWIPGMAAQGWELAGEELAAVGHKSFSPAAGGVRGKALSGKAQPVRIEGPADFVRAADWPALEKWIKTTAESATNTGGERLLKIFRDAAAFKDDETGQGRTPAQIAKKLLEDGVVQAEARAKMLAQTGSVWAYNEGAVQRYQAAGIAVLEWLTAEDELRCEFCASMNGVRIPAGDPFLQAGDQISLGDAGTLKVPSGANGFDIRHPPLHPNCLTRETTIIAPDKLAAFVATYRGPIVELVFSDGRRLSVTPNHMLLTPLGFAHASSLRQGDDVIDGLGGQWIIPAGPENNGQPAQIGDVVEAFAKSRGVSSRRVPVSSEYLHGDAVFVEGHIDVIAADSFFKGDLESPIPEHGRQGPGALSNLMAPGLVRGRDLGSVLRALAFAADGGMGVRRESAAFASRHAAEAEQVCLGSIPARDPVLQQTSGDRRPAQAKRLGQCQFGFPGPVSLAKVVDIQIRDFLGHVYDLQTRSSLYLAEGKVSSNCRCTLIPIVVEE